MLDIAFKIVKAKRITSLLTALVVALSVLLFGFLSGIMAMQQQAMLNIAQLGRGALTLMEKGKGDLDHDDQALGQRSVLTEALWQQVAPLAGDLIEPGESSPVLIEQADDLGFGGPKILLWGIPGEDGGLLHPEVFLGERYNECYQGKPLPAGGRELIFGQRAAEHYGVKNEDIGKEVQLQTALGPIAARLAGIVIDRFDETVGHNDPLSHAIVMPLALAQKVARAEGRISFIRLQPKSPATSAPLGTALKSLEQTTIWTYDDLIRAIDRSLGSMLTIMIVLKYFILFIAAATMFNVFFLTVNNRQQLWSTMKGCGATHAMVFKLIAAESLIISLAGSLLGVAISGLLLTAIVGNPRLAVILFGPALTSAFVIGALVGPVGSFLPAVSAARMEPAQGLRHG